MNDLLSGGDEGSTGGEAQVTGQQTEGTPEATAGEGSQLTPEQQAILKPFMDAAVAQARQEWEGPGGPMAKMQSSLEKKIAELKREKQQASQLRRQQAAELMDTEPEEAARILAGELQALEADTQLDQMQSEATEWIRKIYADLGGNADEGAAAERAAAHVQTLLGSPDPNTAFDVQQAIGREVVEERDKQIKELGKLADKLPDLVRTEVARLHAAGGGPELTTPGGASHKNPIKEETDPTTLLTEAFAEM